ncbi:MAG: hypothetical protein KIT44_07480 [Opitutaceae bacterium]|nr:hypothetical protein [Opitutaceae bacterium]
MRKTLALAGLAVALGFGAPAVAQAAITLPASVAVQGDATLQLVGHKKHHHNYHGRSHHRGHAHYHHRNPPKVVYHRNYRPWSHWQPRVVKHHRYRSFGTPVYYHAHPHYGDYYYVSARDRQNMMLWIGVSAITGAIPFSHY